MNRNERIGEIVARLPDLTDNQIEYLACLMEALFDTPQEVV